MISILFSFYQDLGIYFFFTDKLCSYVVNPTRELFGFIIPQAVPISIKNPCSQFINNIPNLQSNRVGILKVLDFDRLGLLHVAKRGFLLEVLGSCLDNSLSSPNNPTPSEPIHVNDSESNHLSFGEDVKTTSLFNCRPHSTIGSTHWSSITFSDAEKNQHGVVDDFEYYLPK